MSSRWSRKASSDRASSADRLGLAAAASDGVAASDSRRGRRVSGSATAARWDIRDRIARDDVGRRLHHRFRRGCSRRVDHGGSRLPRPAPGVASDVGGAAAHLPRHPATTRGSATTRDGSFRPRRPGRRPRASGVPPAPVSLASTRRSVRPSRPARLRRGRWRPSVRRRGRIHDGALDGGSGGGGPASGTGAGSADEGRRLDDRVRARSASPRSARLRPRPALDRRRLLDAGLDLRLRLQLQGRALRKLHGGGSLRADPRLPARAPPWAR